MEKYDFIKLMLKSRNLSVNDKKRLLLLATQEIGRNESIVQEVGTNNFQGEKPTNKEQPHAPKDTAAFLSLFEDPNGFKFLTHDFGPDSDMDNNELLEHLRSTFENNSRRYCIPPSLYSLMHTMLYGSDKNGKNRTWMDCDGVFHKENITTPTWVAWAHKNPKIHLLSNEEFSNVILKFRSTIRIVKPVLSDIIKRQADKHSKLSIQTEGLEKADFYTYVWKLNEGIRRILDDMSRDEHSTTPNVKITFERKFGDEFSCRIIKIIQIGSVSSSLDDVLTRFHKSEGGAFNEIRKVFNGYCNWSVEALWNGQPQRWNILTDQDIPEIEDLHDSNITGFTHILTFFYK